MTRSCGRRRWGLFGLLALTTLTAACGEESLQLDRWELVEAGGDEAHSVHLPARLDDHIPDREVTYRLHTRVEVPPAWRNQPLTLGIPYFMALTELEANGVEALSLIQEEYEVRRSTGPQIWRIPAEATTEPTLDLTLTVLHRWAPSAWLNTVPRLSPERTGQPLTRTVRAFNRWVNQAGLWILLTIGLTSAFLFLFNRRENRDYGWLAIETVSITFLYAFHLGVTQALVGNYESAVLAFLAVTSIVAGAIAIRIEFGLEPPYRAFATAWVLGAVVSALFRDPFWGTRILGPVTLVLVGIVLADFYRVLWHVYRTDPAHPNLKIRFIGVVAFTVFVGPTVFQWLGLPEPLHGARTVSLGLTFFSLSLFAALTRRHLQARQLSELRHREIEQLNLDLRRQIEERSRRLAEALERLDQAPSEGMVDLPHGVGRGGRA